MKNNIYQRNIKFISTKLQDNFLLFGLKSTTGRISNLFINKGGRVYVFHIQIIEFKKKTCYRWYFWIRRGYIFMSLVSYNFQTLVSKRKRGIWNFWITSNSLQ